MEITQTPVELWADVQTEYEPTTHRACDEYQDILEDTDFCLKPYFVKWHLSNGYKLALSVLSFLWISAVRHLPLTVWLIATHSSQLRLSLPHMPTRLIFILCFVRFLFPV